MNAPRIQENPFRVSRIDFIPTPYEPINVILLRPCPAESWPFKRYAASFDGSSTKRMVAFVSLHPTVVQIISWNEIVLVIVT